MLRDQHELELPEYLFLISLMVHLLKLEKGQVEVQRIEENNLFQMDQTVPVLTF
jgi:hypothetical protein